MTYAEAVVWMWVVALATTLVAFGYAWRALARADAAVRAVRDAALSLQAVGRPTVEAAEATEQAAVLRHGLQDRTDVAPAG